MGIFSRRYLQRCIDESSTFATLKVRKLWVKKLNSPSSPDYAAKEWEIAILNALSKLGELRHEVDFGGTTRPDILYSSQGLEFVADITAVSDKGLHEQNPLELLEEELRKRYERSGITAGGFALIVTATSIPSNRVKSLGIVPPVKSFNEIIFNSAFENFIAKIKASNTERREIEVTYGEPPQSQIRIIYQPGKPGAYCHQYTVYTGLNVINKNPLYYALRDKSDQLKRSGYKGSMGIIVCDGGTRSLSEDRSTSTYSTADVVQEFLRRNKRVNFVAVLTRTEELSLRLKNSLRPKIHVREIEPWHSRLEALFAQAFNALPRITQSPDNARRERRFYKGRETMRPHIGALSISMGTQTSEIKISTRTLLDLLSGRLTAERFNREYRFDNELNPFELELRRGFTLESAVVNRLTDEDDDEIVLKFSGPDPALARFTANDPTKT